MKILIEWIKEDPKEVIGGFIAWTGLFGMVFMMSVVG